MSLDNAVRFIQVGSLGSSAMAAGYNNSLWHLFCCACNLGAGGGGSISPASCVDRCRHRSRASPMSGEGLLWHAQGFAEVEIVERGTPWTTPPAHVPEPPWPRNPHGSPKGQEEEGVKAWNRKNDRVLNRTQNENHNRI